MRATLAAVLILLFATSASPEDPPKENPHVTELIHELLVARENEFTVEEIDLAIHAHPTLSEAVAEAVLDSMGRMIHA